MSPPKFPPAVAQSTGRGPGRDSGGRPINPGPDMGTPDLLDKPSDLTEMASRLWDVLVTELKGSGVLRSVDATALAACCETYSRWSEAVHLRRVAGITTTNRFGDTVRAPWVQVETDASTSLRAWLREFGLTPSAVSSILRPESSPNPLEDPFAPPSP